MTSKCIVITCLKDLNLGRYIKVTIVKVKLLQSDSRRRPLVVMAPLFDVTITTLCKTTTCNYSVLI